MFSQLCRARPRTLWNKVIVRNQATTDDIESTRPNDNELNGEDRCQLDSCTFCDYRVCCKVIASHESDSYCLEYTEPNLQVTDNPAYGLSSKNWLEVSDDQNDIDKQSILNMEPCIDSVRSSECDKCLENLISDTELDITSHQYQDCDANTEVTKMSHGNLKSHILQCRVEAKPKCDEETSPKNLDHGGLTWSMLRHRQQSGDISRNCDKINSVIEHSSDKNPANGSDFNCIVKSKKNSKDRSFPLSLMKPIAKIGDKKHETSFHQPCLGSKNDLSRQRPVQRKARDKFLNSSANKEVENSKKLTTDESSLGNPLSEIAQIKTKESIQEWLARISESANGSWPDGNDEKDSSQGSAWSLVNNTDEEKGAKNVQDKRKCHRENKNEKSFQSTNHLEIVSKDMNEAQPKKEVDTTKLLSNASKASPANVPMVIMQCSRLHSHIGCKPPFQQTSLPMGTLVTALYQESDWFYIQTPHGIKGFVSASNCSPIGTINNEDCTTKRPWEPCDFPIQISIRKQHEFIRQQESYISTKLPNNNGKQTAPYVSTVKMKTNFYSDRYLHHTFKSKDSIKTAKTVTDILRSSPETKVSNL